MAKSSSTSLKAKDHSKAEQEAYAEFIRGLQVEQIVLLSARVRNETGGDLRPEMRPQLSSDAKMLKRSKSGFKVRCDFTFKGHDAESDKDTVLVETAFLLQYSTRIPVDKRTFELFKGSSLFLHAWPYFREYLQSTLTRCGLPVLTLPVIALV